MNTSQSNFDTQVDVLQPEGEISITDRSGKEYKVKEKLPIRSKFRLNQVFGKMLKEMPTLSADRKTIEENFSTVVGEFMSSAMGEGLIDAVAIIFGLETPFVEKNFEEEEVLRVVIPFYLKETRKATGLIVDTFAGKRQGGKPEEPDPSQISKST